MVITNKMTEGMIEEIGIDLKVMYVKNSICTIDEILECQVF